MNTSDPVVTIPIVDTSSSMKDYGYVTLTVIDTCAFLNMALPGDDIGVASYDTTGRVTFPLTRVDENGSVQTKATDAVQRLKFSGSTSIGAGIRTAVGMLPASSTTDKRPRALVLLSDGEENRLPDALPLPAGTPPIYTCSMGPFADLNLMEKIATKSGGKHYDAPRIDSLMKIYEQIRAQTSGANLLGNVHKELKGPGKLSLSATASEGNDLLQFSVAWSDPQIPFHNGSREEGKLSVELVDPWGRILTPKEIRQGPASVVLNVPQAQAGEWELLVMYGGTQPQELTAGILQYAHSGKAAAIVLSEEVPATVKAGTPLRFSVGLTDDGEAVAGQQILATVTKPKLSIKNALNTYAPLLEDVVLPEEATDSPTDPNIAKLKALYQARLPHEDLLPHITSVFGLSVGKDGRYEGVSEDTLQAGMYNIELQVTGFSEKSKTPFSRSKLFSVLVTD